jgi:hypothetical protein
MVEIVIFGLIIIFVAGLFSRLRFHIFFKKKHGRRHAILGSIEIIVLIIGFIDASGVYRFGNTFQRLLYHTVLGCMGLLLTLSAAFEFQHKHVKNIASGTLDKHATVTYSEMIEHSFYQAVNLVQIVFICCIGEQANRDYRIVYVLVASSPWLLRAWFPINKFSDNYILEDAQSTTLIRCLYRIKKYQYVFYKHFILHGLNISIAIAPTASMRHQLYSKQGFHLFWMLLNTSYVMEFFLQTLVKKAYMSQNVMLVLQQVLMVASSLSALHVLREVDIVVALASTFMNFLHRKNDFANTALVLLSIYLSPCIRRTVLPLISGYSVCLI